REDGKDTVAGAQTERRGGAGPAGACLTVRAPPAAVLLRTDGRYLLLLLIKPQQRRGFRPEVAKLLLLRPVLLRPLHCPVVPLAGLVPFAELPVGHCQEEPVEAVAALPELHGPR